jgi:serine/threonine-protein kinase
LVAAGLVTGIAIGLAVSTGCPGTDDDARSISRFEVPFRSSQVGGQVTFSPDGQTLVHRAVGSDGRPRLFRRVMDTFDSTPIDNTEDGTQPFFSPDGRWLGFFVSRTLRRVPASGGPAETITELPVFPDGATWDTDSIVVGGGDRGLLRVPLAGGEPSVITAAEDGRRFSDPQMLPGGRAILFTESRISAGVRGADAPALQIVDLETGRRHTLLEGAAGRFVPPGHLVFQRSGTLWGVAFEAGRFAVGGAPVPLVEGSRGGIGRFTVADEGSLAYVSENAARTRQLVWVNRAGREEAIAAPARGYTYPRLSPDGRRVAIDVRDEGIDIWVLGLAGETLTRLTFDPAQDEYPVWTRDGRQILFASFRDKAWGVFAQSADGSGATQRVGTAAEEIDPLSLSPDGRTLVARVGGDVVTLPLGGASDVQPLLATPFREVNADISPDGRWVAYQSNESGRDEIYVRPFPAVASGLWQISNGGGTHPVWGSSGRELFYVAAPALMSAPIQPGPRFASGNPQVVIKDAADSYWLSAVGRSYDVSPDGERFLMLKEETQTSAAIQVVRNWRGELNRLVPIP